jgi:CPA2 family monovalent cation:H+ antiporter-2
MTQIGFFADLGLLLLAALVGGILAHFLRQPLIVGYLIGGILIGPFTPGPTLSEPEVFRLFAEVGVVLLMFSIGIEFAVGDVFKAGRVGLLGAPLGIALVMFMALPIGWIFGWPLRQTLVVGAAASVASTMVLLKFLSERGELHSPHGRILVAITLAEDLVVVAMTVLIPTMAQAEPGSALRLFFAGLLQAALLLAPFLLLSRRLVPALLDRIARAGDMELFLLIAMTIAIGTAALTASFGLSLALGAFLAGLLISGSEFAHETLARVLPIRDLFIAVFFVSIGTLIRPASLVAHFPVVLALVALVVLGKFIVRAGTIRVLGSPVRTAVLAGLGVTQIGEFSYVLAGVGREHGLLTGSVYDAVLAASVLSIIINALIFRRSPRRLTRWLDRMESLEDQADAVPMIDHVLICGLGRVGKHVADALESFTIPYAIVDLNPRMTQEARRRGVPAVFGDAGNEIVLRRAGAERTRLAVVAIPDFDAAYRCVRVLRTLRADVPIIARVHEESQRVPIQEAGANEVIQPEIEAGLTIVRHSLDRLGIDHHDARLYIERIRERWTE